jgi:tetratricopeptide (TPR) repeat protein
MARKVKAKVQSLWAEVDKLYDKQEFDKVILVLDHIDYIANSDTVDTLILMRATNTRAIISLHNHDLNNAEKYFVQSLNYAKQTGDPIFIASRYDNLAATYFHKKELNRAIGYLQMSINLKEESGNQKDILVSLANMISLQTEIADIDGAEKSLNEYHFLIKKYSFGKAYPQYYCSIALLKEEQKKLPEAIIAYSKAIKYAIQFNDYATVAKAYTNQGKLYLHEKNLSKAEPKYIAALKIAHEHKLREVGLLASTHLGLIALEKGDILRGRELYEYVDAAILPTDIDLLLSDFEELRSRLYEAEGQYEPALAAYKNYLGYYKKQFDKEMKSSVQNLQAKYEAEKKDRALEKAKLLQAQSELKALRAQMDPHFIFNALSSMRKELLEGNLEGADAYLVRFSKLLRLILDTTRTPEVRLSDNIELLHLYIQIEKNRQSDKFDYTINTKDIDPDSTFVPGLILQPLAENAIIHGLYHKKNGKGKLDISFSKIKDTLVIKVRDNGIGRLASKAKAKPGHTSHAMAIIRETLDITWQGRNVKNYFTIRDLMTKDNINIGTEVTVLLPLS